MSKNTEAIIYFIYFMGSETSPSLRFKLLTEIIISSARVYKYAYISEQNMKNYSSLLAQASFSFHLPIRQIMLLAKGLDLRLNENTDVN